MEIEDDSDFHDYQPQEETNYLASVEDTTETSTQSGPITLPSIVLPPIPLPTLVPRRGLLVISESGSSQLTRRQGVGLVSVITAIRYNLKLSFLHESVLNNYLGQFICWFGNMHVTLHFHQLNRIGLPQNANSAVFLHPTVLTLGYIRRAEI